MKAMLGFCQLMCKRNFVANGNNQLEFDVLAFFEISSHCPHVACLLKKYFDSRACKLYPGKLTSHFAIPLHALNVKLSFASFDPRVKVIQASSWGCFMMPFVSLVSVERMHDKIHIVRTSCFECSQLAFGFEIQFQSLKLVLAIKWAESIIS